MDSIWFATNRNINSLKDLFNQGLASLWDVSYSRGFSLDYAYRKKCSCTELVELQCIILNPSSIYIYRDWVEEQKFPLIHNIIIGRSRKLLSVKLNNNPDAISNIRVLINRSSPLNTIDISGRTTVLYVVDSHNDNALRILLEASANPNPKVLEGLFRSSPLIAASFGGLVGIIKLLLKFGAKVNACNLEGRTALHTVASINGRLLLMTAIFYNNYAVLELFIDWCDTSSFKGLQLLPIIAKSVDAKTMAILAASNLLKQTLDEDGFAAGRETLWSRIDYDEVLDRETKDKNIKKIAKKAERLLPQNQSATKTPRPAQRPTLPSLQSYHTKISSEPPYHEPTHRYPHESIPTLRLPGDKRSLDRVLRAVPIQDLIITTCRTATSAIVTKEDIYNRSIVSIHTTMTTKRQRTPKTLIKKMDSTSNQPTRAKQGPGITSINKPSLEPTPHKDFVHSNPPEPPTYRKFTVFTASSIEIGAAELDALEQADIIYFFFDTETKSPISLLELGLWIASDKVVVCCGEVYWKSRNVYLICDWYGVKCVKTFAELVPKVEKMLKAKGMKLDNNSDLIGENIHVPKEKPKKKTQLKAEKAQLKAEKADLSASIYTSQSSATKNYFSIKFTSTFEKPAKPHSGITLRSAQQALFTLSSLWTLCASINAARKTQ
ncbi:ankyrin repeat containing [Pyrenophora seminiperda CCB06]|uniref:Ankyrin repeat containing n=1 Tax=Pyrenophora seminiperda CCB06 TaxID=1302712 RepID=A0A3M7LVS4_9PLEO|nr:ankyrin repeat containing [Pyrenophora seminiperda CCB06]